MALCTGCLIQECRIEGNTSTPCTCAPSPLDVARVLRKRKAIEHLNNLPPAEQGTQRLLLAIFGV